MQSTSNLRDTDPHDVFVIEPDVSLAARSDKAPLDLLYDVLSRPSDTEPAPAQIKPDPGLRIAPDFSASTSVAPAPVEAANAADDIQLGDSEISAHQPGTSKFARRAFMSLLAVVGATGAAAWQHYGDDAKATMARYAPPFMVASLASPEKSSAAEQAPAAADEAPATDQAQAATSVASAAPDQTQAIQSMARDLAAMGQQITELKASIEQLKANQQQAAVTPAAPVRAAEVKPAEPAAPLVRPKIVPPPAHSTVATLAKRPKQVFPYAPIAPSPPPQQAAAPARIAPPPPPPQMAEDGGPVVRPPLALH